MDANAVNIWLAVGLLVANVVLATITFFYMQHTKKMANTMYKDYELRTTPLADTKILIERGYGPVSPPQERPRILIFTIKIKNLGYIQMRICSGQWSYWANHITDNEPILYTYSPDVESSKQLWLKPGEERIFNSVPINVPNEYWNETFRPDEHISLDGWLDCMSATNVVKRYDVKRNLGGLLPPERLSPPSPRRSWWVRLWGR